MYPSLRWTVCSPFWKSLTRDVTSYWQTNWTTAFLEDTLGTHSDRTISKNSSGCRLLIGHKKFFVLLCPIDEQFLLSSFRESYRTAIVSMTNAPKKCTQSGKFQFDVKSRSDFKVLSARKLNTLSKNTSLSLQQVFTLESVKSCVNIREFLKIPRRLPATKTSQGKVNSHFFQSLSWLFQLAYFATCKWTLLKLNFYLPYPSSWREWILSWLVYVLHKTWN